MIDHHNPFSLWGKHILITGASSGIGRAIAIACANQHAKMTITGRDAARLEETLAMLNGDGHSFKAFDLKDDDALAEFVAGIPNLDGVVYCAGIQKTAPARLIQKADMDEIFDTNFFSVINLNKLLLNKKKMNNGASVVFISSTAAGIVAEMGNAMYSASKGAISSFAKVLALELSQKKIRVNCVLPAMVRTPLLENISVDTDQLEQDEKRYPFGYGTPEDVAYAVIYLLSGASKWVTGTNLLLDGGLTLK